MTKIEITTEEKILLKDYLRTTPLVLIRFKCQAVLMREKGIKIKDIADIVSRDGNTVSHWLKDWNEKRMASIFSGHQNNSNANKLTKEQKEEIKKVLSKPPDDFGLPKKFWDVPALKKYISVTFDVVYKSDRSYHFLLSFSHLSFKYPDTFDFHRDEIFITKRMEEIHQEIKPFLENPDWEIFASDEVRIELEAFTRKAWLEKRKKNCD